MSMLKTFIKQYGWSKLTAYAIAILCLAAGGIWLGYRGMHASSDKEQKLQQQQAQAEESQKKANVNDGKAAGGDSSTSGQADYTPPDTPDNLTLSASESNHEVTVTTKLFNYSDGTCSLTVNNGSKTTSRTAPVIYQAQFSTCAGFTIPVSALDAGTWSFSLSVTSGGITTTKTITANVT